VSLNITKMPYNRPHTEQISHRNKNEFSDYETNPAPKQKESKNF